MSMRRLGRLTVSLQVFQSFCLADESCVLYINSFKFKEEGFKHFSVWQNTWFVLTSLLPVKVSA